MFVRRLSRLGKTSEQHRHYGIDRRKPGPRKLFLEILEDRTLPSTLTVTNNLDSGPGSLRYEIAQAAAGDTINFDPSLQGMTINLITGQLGITKNLSIVGLGADQLAVSGANLSRVFEIDPAAVVSISYLTIESGQIAGDGTNDGSSEGGGIFNSGVLTLSNDVISNNLVIGIAGSNGDSTTPQGGNGGDAQGGGIFNAPGATLALMNDTLSSNQAIGGVGGSGFGSATAGNGGQGLGGGVFSAAATLSFSQVTLSNNQALGGSGGAGASAGFFNEGSGSGAGNGGNAQGGGFYSNDLQLTISQTTFTGNQAIGGSGGAGGNAYAVFSNVGGNGGNGGSGGSAQGGGFYSNSSLTLNGDSLSNNQ